MSKRKYPTDISETSGAFTRAIQRKRPRRTNVSVARSSMRNVARRQFFPSRGNMPMPMSWTTTHRYCAVVTFNPPAGTPSNWIFSANGLYDPDITGTGHQPMGFDQMMAFYNHYEVIGAKIRFTPHLGAEGSAFNYGVKLDDSSTFAVSNIEGILEHPLNNWKSWSGPYTSLSNFDVVQTFSNKRFFGDKSGDRATWGDAASNPQDQAYFLCWIAPLTALQDIGPIPCTITIEYIVKYHEPKDLTQS